MDTFLFAQVVESKKRSGDNTTNESNKRQKTSDVAGEDEVVFEELKTVEDIHAEKFKNADVCDVSDESTSPTTTINIKDEKKTPEDLKHGVFIYKSKDGEYTDTYVGQVNIDTKQEVVSFFEPKTHTYFKQL